MSPFWLPEGKTAQAICGRAILATDENTDKRGSGKIGWGERSPTILATDGNFDHFPMPTALYPLPLSLWPLFGVP